MTLSNTKRRQYARRSIDVGVQLTLSEACLSQISPVSGRRIAARMMDVSGGGAYVVVPTYLPRATQVELEIPPGSGLPSGQAPCRVMKIRMVDRDPRYGLGLRFEDTDCDLVKALQAADAEEAER